MPRRLGPKPPDVPQAPPQTPYVQARTKGLQLLATLNPAALTRVVTIDTPEGYLQMDRNLALIRNVRAQWLQAFQPILGPLEKTIEKQKEALAHAKEAAKGAKDLSGEITGKLDTLERHVKLLMENYKRLEAEQIEEAKRETERQALALKNEAAKKKLASLAAKTPQVRARLEQQAAEVAAQAEQVQAQAETLAPVKGASSSSRTQKKVRVKDPLAFLAAVRDYTPVGGVYEMGTPPLMTTDKKGEPAPLVDIVAARLNDLFREQPGVVASWPGVEVFDDISIANR